MSSIGQTLGEHHKDCDTLFAECEDAILRGRWDLGVPAHARLCREVEAHLCAEEEVLFTAFEEQTGITEGPTRMMRIEHEQMRGMLARMGEAVSARDTEAYAGLADTLLILMRQHNLKEEGILYPMCERSLAGQSVDVIRRLVEHLEAA